MALSATLKKRLASGLAIAAAVVPTLGIVAAPAASAAPQVTYSGEMTDVFSGSTANRAAVDTVTNTAFDAGTDMAYSLVKYLVDFFSQPAVLAVIISIMVIYLIGMAVVRKFKRGSHIGAR